MLQSKTPVPLLGTDMATEPLGNLTDQSARVGTWLLSVATVPRTEEYKWTRGNITNTGKTFECLLVSEDSTEYGMGVFRNRCKEPSATKDIIAGLAKLIQSNTWKVSNITLAKPAAKYLWRPTTWPLF